RRVLVNHEQRAGNRRNRAAGFRRPVQRAFLAVRPQRVGLGSLHCAPIPCAVIYRPYGRPATAPAWRAAVVATTPLLADPAAASAERPCACRAGHAPPWSERSEASAASLEPRSRYGACLASWWWRRGPG